MKKYFIYFFLTILLFNISCIKQKTLHDLKYQQIYTYITQTGLIFDTTKSGFFIHTNFKGVNNFNRGDSVHLVYTALYLDPKYNGNNVTFAKNDSFSFIVGDREILKAWNEITDDFGEGGSGIAILPYDKAYGKEHTPDIPPYSNIVYYFRFYSDNYRTDQLSKFYQYAMDYDTLSIKYTDTLIYAKYFDISGMPVSSSGLNIDFSLYTIDDSLLSQSSNYFINLIQSNIMPAGFLEGISHMTSGEMGKIIIPPDLSYTSDNYFDISPYTALYAEVRTIPDNVDSNQLSKTYKYLYINKLQADSILSNGVFYIKNKAGTSTAPTYGSTINYSDSLYVMNQESPIESCQQCSKVLNSSNFLPGQLSGILMMKAGGEATFIIPYQQGYGSDWHGDIPPYSILIYKIKLESVE